MEVIDGLNTQAERISFIIIKENLTQAKLARKIGLHRSTISAICRNKIPISNKTATCIERILGYSKEWLIDGKGNQRTDLKARLNTIKEIENIINSIGLDDLIKIKDYSKAIFNNCCNG